MIDEIKIKILVVVVMVFTLPILCVIVIDQFIKTNMGTYHTMTYSESNYYDCKACTNCFAYEENTRYGWYSTSDGIEWSCGCYNLETDEWTGECNVTEDGDVIY